jgi:hypothetical protein
MKNKFTWIVLAFLIGVLIGGAIIWLCCGCCCKKQCNEHCQVAKPFSLKTAPKLIDTIAANAHYHTYLLAPVSVDTLKAFTINLEQYYAMGLILNADTSVHGFRIYMGADSIPSNQIMMVVGTGSPDKTGTIYSTTAAGSGPCPFICDKPSPIIK